MTGVLVELAARGAQDAYLVGSPTVTFFKSVHKKHSNFAVECIKVGLEGAPGWGRGVKAKLSRAGDLVGKVYIHTKLDKLTDTDPVTDDPSARWCDQVGFAMLEDVRLSIGGQLIDRISGRSMQIGAELGLSGQQNLAMDEMVLGRASVTRTFQADQQQELFVPLDFFFCNNNGLALPLISLQYHEVDISFDIAPFADVVDTLVEGFDTHSAQIASVQASGHGKILECDLCCNYIYLDADERKRFARMNHEYLISQTQHHGMTNIDSVGANGREERIELNFNHPVKELQWVVSPASGIKEQKDAMNLADQAEAVPAGQVSPPNAPTYRTQHTFVYGQGDLAPQSNLKADVKQFQEPVSEAKISLNGHDRYDYMSGLYHRVVQPYEKHTSVPDQEQAQMIYMYSFALQPEEHQPSGTCNFSRIDRPQLHLRLKTCASSQELRVYARSYNVLRVMSGMAGLAYSN